MIGVKPRAARVKRGKNAYAKSLPLLLIAAPGILYLIINNYIPMFGIFLAFKNYSFRKGIFGSDWNGLQNFRFLFSTKDAWIITRNTLLYNIAFIVLGTIFSVFVAILMAELGEKLRTKFFQSALLLPNLLSWVVIAVIGYAFLNADNGFFNKTLLPLLGTESVAWYSETKYWPVILVIVYIWKYGGYNSIIYMASIAGIDKSIFEAAGIDGASKVQQIRYMTLPMLKSMVILMTLMSVGRIFYSDFGLFYQVPQNSGALFSVTQTIDTYVYRGLMVSNDVGMSAAAGLYQSVVGFIIVMAANAVVKKIDSESALF